MAVIPNLKSKSQHTFQNCSSPFRRDKNPSFSISHNQSNNTWYHTDFGDASVQGNIFDFAALRYGLDKKVDFRELLDKMYHELHIDEMDTKELQKLLQGCTGESETIAYNLRIPLLTKSKQPFEDNAEADVEEMKIYKIILDKIEEGDLDIKHKEFLSQTGIRYETMKEYNTFFISAYTVTYREVGYDDAIRKVRPKDEIWISYFFNNYCKIYSPLSKRFWYAGKKICI